MRLSLFLAILFAGSIHAEEQWVPLFDGKSLDGWTPKFKGEELGFNYLDTFQVKNGVLTVNYDKYTKFDERYGHLFFKEKFSQYKIRIEYRFIGDQCPGGPGWATRNSGVMLHCQDPKTMSKDQSFPVSIEAQFLGGLGKGKRPTANMCSPGTNVVMDGKLFTTHCTSSKSKTYDRDQWVTVEIEVHGAGKITHRIGGEVVLEYEQPQYDPKDKDAQAILPKGGDLLIHEGYIALQAESHPCEFRKVEVMKLAPRK